MKRYKYLILMIVLMILNFIHLQHVVNSVTYANKFFAYQGGLTLERVPVYRDSYGEEFSHSTKWYEGYAVEFKSWER